MSYNKEDEKKYLRRLQAAKYRHSKKAKANYSSSDLKWELDENKQTFGEYLRETASLELMYS